MVLELFQRPSHSLRQRAQVRVNRRLSESTQPELFVAAIDLPEETFAVSNKKAHVELRWSRPLGKTPDACSQTLRRKPCAFQTLPTLVSGYSMSSNGPLDSTVLLDASTLRTCTSTCRLHTLTASHNSAHKETSSFANSHRILPKWGRLGSCKESHSAPPCTHRHGHDSGVNKFANSCQKLTWFFSGCQKQQPFVAHHHKHDQDSGVGKFANLRQKLIWFFLGCQ